MWLDSECRRAPLNSRAEPESLTPYSPPPSDCHTAVTHPTGMHLGLRDVVRRRPQALFTTMLFPSPGDMTISTPTPPTKIAPAFAPRPSWIQRQIIIHENDHGPLPDVIATQRQHLVAQPHTPVFPPLSSRDPRVRHRARRLAKCPHLSPESTPPWLWGRSCGRVAHRSNTARSSSCSEGKTQSRTTRLS